MKFYKGQLKEISIEEIDFENKSFYFSYPERAPFLKDSIRELGLIEPPLLTIKGNKYVIISGVGRIKALIELGVSSFPALILEEKIPEKILLLMALETNLKRGLNLLEKALFLERAKNLYPEREIINLLPKLDFAPHPKWVFFLNKVLALDEEFKNLLAKEELNPKVIEYISDLNPKEREEFLQILKKIKPTFSEQRDIIETLVDLKRRKGEASLVPQDLEVILKEENVTLRKAKFMEKLMEIKYPTFYKKKKAN